LTLSKALQSPSIDLIQAIQRIKDVQRLLKSKRDDSEAAFMEVWQQAIRLAKEADVALEIPHQASRQTYRANIPAANEIEYFRRSHYIPFLDSMLQEFHDRFLGHSKAVFHLSAVVPAHINSYSFDDLLPAFHMYTSFMDSETQVRAEYQLWKEKWVQVSVNDRQVSVNDRPNTAVWSLQVCSPDFFPNVRKLLLIAATLPVTTATPKRTFSSLRLLDNHLCTTMRVHRLAALSLLYLHRDIPVTSEQVIEKFSRQCRRQEFIL